MPSIESWWAGEIDWSTPAGRRKQKRQQAGALHTLRDGSHTSGLRSLATGVSTSACEPRGAYGVRLLATAFKIIECPNAIELAQTFQEFVATILNHFVREVLDVALS